MSRPGDRLRYEAADRDAWTLPGSSAALRLTCVVWVLWWAVSIIVGPIRLSMGRREDGMTDEVWGSGDGR